MSKLFFDHLLNLNKLAKKINKIGKTVEEREELWNLVDELIHHRVVGCILDKLPQIHHQEFLTRLHGAPYDEKILPFVSDKANEDIEKIIKKEMKLLSDEIISDIIRK